MIPWLLRSALRVGGRRVTVPIAQCVHYGAFRYGRGEEHPYESYARKAAAGDIRGARAWLVEFLRHYRPRDFGAALGVRLSRDYPMWSYPWTRGTPTDTGWFADPDGPPDIITFYSDAGILWFRIEQEFFWLDRILYSIRRDGYRPRDNGGIVARKLVRSDATEAFLILDGNHRLSALAALGHETVDLTYLPSSVVREEHLARWPKVAGNLFCVDDARAVLHAYFDGNSRWRITDIPAPLIGNPVL